MYSLAACYLHVQCVGMQLMAPLPDGSQLGQSGGCAPPAVTCVSAQVLLLSAQADSRLLGARACILGHAASVFRDVQCTNQLMCIV